MTSIAYTSGDPVALAKALSKYAKDNPEYTFKAGMVEGRVIAISEIDALAASVEGRDLLQAAVPDDRTGAAPGDRDERGRPRPGLVSIRAWRRASLAAQRLRRRKQLRQRKAPAEAAPAAQAGRHAGRSCGPEAPAEAAELGLLAPTCPQKRRTRMGHPRFGLSLPPYAKGRRRTGHPSSDDLPAT